jgi:hypothetical protein
MPQLAVPLLVSGIMTGTSYGLQALTRRKQKPQPIERGRNDDLRILKFLVSRVELKLRLGWLVAKF